MFINILKQMSFQKGYLASETIDYANFFGFVSGYIYTLKRYIEKINKPCMVCNSFNGIRDSCQLIHTAYKGELKIYKYGKDFIMKFEEHPYFIVVDDQIPKCIIEVIELIYKDVTTDQQMPATIIKGEVSGNQICFYHDKYGTLTMYSNINENNIYSVMTISDRKKHEYREFLYNQAFTYESKRNCSC
jgi:hypothetical protein